MYKPKHDPPKPLLHRTLHSHESDPEPLVRPAPRNDSAVGSSLPPSFVERGEVTSNEEMTTKYTDEEWTKVIRKAEEELGEADEEKRYEWDGGLADKIDHTLLKLDATREQFDQLCQEAKEYEFATVCVRPDQVAQCAQSLQNTPTKVCSVISFHEGTSDLSAKVQETRLALTSGAKELDLVLNRPLLQAKNYSTLFHELATVRTQAPAPTVLKLILETSQLSREEIIAACVLAEAASFDFVKTSTGFCGAGATVENVRLMRKCCEVLADGVGVGGNHGRVMKVKASGGIRTYEDAKKMLEAGASRLGCSAGVTIVREAKEGKRTEVEGEDGGY